MSRIAQAVINSAFDSTLESIIAFFNPNELDLNILNMDSMICTFEAHQLDLNQKLYVISPEIINHNISVLPKAILCCWLAQYNNAKNLASMLRLPMINIIKNDSANIKKESAFELSRNLLIDDINLVESDAIAQKLFISNYSLLTTDIKPQIIKLINKWQPN